MEETDRGNDEVAALEKAKLERYQEIRNMSDPALMAVPLEELNNLPEVFVYRHQTTTQEQRRGMLMDPDLRKIISIIELREGRE
jgi:hypothetical protein